MRRIIYVPWPKSACPVTARDVAGWADSYGKRTHKFANNFLPQRCNAQVFGYTERLATSITGVLAFKSAVEGPDNDRRIRIGASNFRQRFHAHPDFL
jgi:hypothetical protein